MKSMNFNRRKQFEKQMCNNIYEITYGTVC